MRECQAERDEIFVEHRHAHLEALLHAGSVHLEQKGVGEHEPKVHFGGLSG